MSTPTSEADRHRERMGLILFAKGMTFREIGRTVLRADVSGPMSPERTRQFLLTALRRHFGREVTQWHDTSALRDLTYRVLVDGPTVEKAAIRAEMKFRRTPEVRAILEITTGTRP